ncbi:MAG: response regulator transcription factor [Burkholderiales bacterium]|nr:response regulator transcription factor [Burkholderiales bacterium]
MSGRTIIPAGTYTESGYPVIGHAISGVATRYAGMSLRRGMQASLVYLVEDDLDICEALEFMLTANGFEVLTCESGAALLAQLKPGVAASVLMDLRLPDVDGLDLLVTLRSQAPSLPVIVMTGFGQVQMAVRAMKLGALDFLEKPIDERELVDLLRRAQAPVAARVNSQATGLLAELTAREVETLSKLVQGLTSKQAAQQLGISPRTVDVHRASILQKLGAPTTMAALAMLRQLEPEQYHLLVDSPDQFFALSQGKALRDIAG